MSAQEDTWDVKRALRFDLMNQAMPESRRSVYVLRLTYVSSSADSV